VILLDTAVLVYAVGEPHPLREPCRTLLAAHAEGRVVATTTIEVIREFIHIRSRRRPRTDAVILARHYLDALDPLMTSASEFRRGLDLFEKHPGLGAFDSVLCGVALERGAEALVSADRALASIPGLRWIDPASPELESLLAGEP
jgi:predicted nucleic acid-binding protein